MGIAFSNSNIVFTGQAFAGTDEDACKFMKLVNDSIVAAGWSSTPSFAHIAFGILALSQGDKFFCPNQNLILIEPGNTAPPGFLAVPFDPSSQLNSANNLAAAMVPAIGAGSAVVTLNGGILTITLSNVSGGTDGIGNNVTMSVFPSGSVGIFDYGAGSPGTGKTWGGGYNWTSATFSGNPLTIIARKDPAINISLQESVSGVIYNKFSFAAQIQILANKYQFFLLTVGAYNSGTFFVAGHLFPLGGISQFNYTCGPVALGGGNRNQGFNSISSGDPIINGNLINTTIAFQIPNYISGSLTGLNITRDQNSINGKPQAIFFDPFICDVAQGIGGMFWDSFIMSAGDTIDSSASFGGYGLNNSTIVLTSSIDPSVGAGASFAVFKTSIGGIPGINQLDSETKGSTPSFDLVGPSDFLTTINSATGLGPPPNDTSSILNYSF